MSGGTEAAGFGAGAEDTSQWRYTTLFALSIGGALAFKDRTRPIMYLVDIIHHNKFVILE